MKLGDLVIKTTGNNMGKIGVVLEVNKNPVGYTIVKVYSENKIRNWYGEYVELFCKRNSVVMCDLK